MAQDTSKTEFGAEVYETHVEEFVKVLEEDPDAAFQRFGFFYVHSLPAAKRLEVYQKYGWLGRDADDLYNLGTAALQSDDRNEARKLYQKALELEPEHFEANWNMAILSRDKGDKEAARTFATRALEHAPEEERETLREFGAELG